MTLTQERLREVLHYDPETGIFCWRIDRKKCRAGSQAGCVRENRNGKLYRLIRIDYKLYLAHRLAWLYMTGEWPSAEVDHRDGNGTHNRWNNLRSATSAQNGANRGANRNNTTGFKGVTFSARRGRFWAQITVGGKHHFLGYFDTAKAANAAYVSAAEKLQGEFAQAS